MTQDEIRKRFVYERSTGLLRSRDPGLKPYPWRPMGVSRKYLAHTYGPGGKTIYLHQAVWLYHKGFIPPMLDHRDGDPRNCKIGNLRVCTPAQNQYNSKRKANNRSGFKGVVYRTGYRHPWQARITVNKRVVLVGRFDTAREAHLAYVAAARKYAGAFARAE